MKRSKGNSKRSRCDARRAAEKIVGVLQEAGHEAYFAGGCVREMLRGRADEATDYDVATGAPPEVVRRVFRRTRLVGEAFGVALVRLMGCEIEVATFRREWGYTDGRRPGEVEYADAEHDAHRRDFTINGMFYDPVAEQVHDYVGGRADLEAGVIRAIGDPHERFGEDYLRMLRAVRFAARLRFAVEPATRRAIEAHAPKLARISRERIGMEVRMMLETSTRADAAELLEAFGLDAPTLMADTSGPRKGDRERLRCLRGLPADAPYPAALAAWMIDRLCPAVDEARPMAEAIERMKVVQHVRRWRRALVLANESRAALMNLLHEMPLVLRWGELGVAQRKRLMARPHWAELVMLLGAVCHRGGWGDFNLSDFERQTAQLATEGVAPEPLITGDDLIALGLQPGPAFKHLLDEVYDAQLEGRIASRDEARALAKRAARRRDE